MQTYVETVNRYVIERHEELPEGHKAELRAYGIDPDDKWDLIWSFWDEEAAERQLASSIENARSYQTYRLRDLGAPVQIERPLI